MLILNTWRAIKIAVLWYETSCSLVYKHQCFKKLAATFFRVYVWYQWGRNGTWCKGLPWYNQSKTLAHNATVLL